MVAMATFVEAVESISPRPSQLPWAGGVGCPASAGLARRAVTCHPSCLRQGAEALGKVVGGQGQQQMASGWPGWGRVGAGASLCRALERLCHKGLLFPAQDTLNNNSLGKKHSWQDRVSRSSSPLKTGKWGPLPLPEPQRGRRRPRSLPGPHGEAPLALVSVSRRPKGR